MRTRRFVAAALTPAILVVGLLALLVVHFRNTLALAQQSEQAMAGTVVYSAGPLQLEFHRDTGVDRPRILDGQQEALQYADWSSSVVVDGRVYSFWDESHGYSFDAAHQQVVSVVTGPGWQVIQVASVRARAVEVAYSFVAGPGGSGPEPHEVTLAIVHQHASWLDPRVAGTTFQAGLVPATLASPAAGVTLRPSRLVWLRAAPAVGVRASMALVDARVTTDPATGADQRWADELTTTYTVLDPQPNAITPVATETTTVTPSPR